ncbi:MAG: hypothetical protein L0I29_16130 [Hyphomicrobiales bacterium]|nr:hypothetical protein [Hyphomicrobiales bacterium]
MRKAVFAILALGLATTVAYAQTDTTPPAQPQSPPAAEPGAAPPPPPAGPDVMHGQNGMRGPGRHGPRGWQKHHGMMMGSKAAHFRIRSGDTTIDVKCAADDTTAACGETVMQLLDKLQTGQSAEENQGGDDSMMNE